MEREELPGFRVGSDWRFHIEVIDRWCLGQNAKPNASRSARR
jgi:hypothetical protein